MSHKRIVYSTKDVSSSPTRKSSRISKPQTLNDLSNTEMDDNYQKLLEENEKMKNKSWIDICESGKKSECVSDERSSKSDERNMKSEHLGDTSSSTRSRKQAAPKKSSTTPRFLRSRAKEQNHEDGMNRKRRMDRSRSFVNEEECNSNNIEMRGRKSPRKKICTSQSSTSSSSSNNNQIKTKEGWSEPKLGWCKDPEVLMRRTREIERAKEKSVYGEYLEAIPKYERVKGIHPKTPNKFINYSRRSWDAQMKLWKRSLYDFFGRTPDTSCRTTPRVSRDTSPVNSMLEGCKREVKEEKSNIGNVDFSINHLDPDRMSSLLSKFEMDSRKKFQDNDDESTLKASTTKSEGPTTFDNVI